VNVTVKGYTEFVGDYIYATILPGEAEANARFVRAIMFMKRRGYYFGVQRQLSETSL
jgi:penicillin V acylase-like amidase (Ntn superfamily)